MTDDEKKLALDNVRVNAREIDETGDYDLEGSSSVSVPPLMVSARSRVFLDTIENLFSGLQNEQFIRVLNCAACSLAERQGSHRRDYRRTRRRGTHPSRTRRVRLRLRYSPSTIALTDQVSTRRLRIVKIPRARRTAPRRIPIPDRRGRIQRFAGDLAGFATSCKPGAYFQRRPAAGIPCWAEQCSTAAAPSWSRELREPAKTSLAAQFVDAACRRGERCIYFSFEEFARATHAKHAVDRHRPRPVEQEKPASVSFQPGHALRS